MTSCVGSCALTVVSFILRGSNPAPSPTRFVLLSKRQLTRPRAVRDHIGDNESTSGSENRHQQIPELIESYLSSTLRPSCWHE
jgi:hypothetical protein